MSNIETSHGGGRGRRFGDFKITHSEFPEIANLTFLTLNNPEDRKKAVGWLVSGEYPFIMPFGNILGAFTHPSSEAVGNLNALKGRPREQTGSITTSPNHYSELANWAALDQAVLTEGTVLDIVDHLSTHGPVGFILPAADSIPPHLSKEIMKQGKQIKTVQLIVPGKNSPVSDIFRAAADKMPKETPYFFATSANRSGTEVHHRYNPLVAELIQDRKGKFVVVVDDERQMRRRHPYHDSRSTTIIDMTDVVRDSDGQVLRDEKGRPLIAISRHGSAHEAYVRKVLAQHGFGAQFPDQRIPERIYPGEGLPDAVRRLRATAAVRLLPRITRSSQ
ncbi:MAG TPA: hypothetical protein VNW29_02760 [Candidatus Sulfotelmatobacter sp.]|nr:hypothetical protein [Candidatus Sulfotelmatobacter sp.]